ncbi:hypothetical protein FRC14_002505 [Serendipita sp. 396]|nr:hypothetical protein FRC14_002505 [Serendipita sp. 396]KAG8776619.1 hypothetical protein FRC15_011847 [Serendipita sp. 397]KAG8850518.1 hypothetical protein FRB91_008997 [Serendipita sp. 411]KAG8859819.1 hypothetical protein FRC20_011781 [Serendipita sp. 405]
MLNNVLSSFLLALLSSHLLSVNGANHDVTLSGLSYSPNHLDSVAAGDTITFMASGGSHTATQSSLVNPCVHATGGFDSGTLNSGQTYQITVNDTNPIWVYCMMPGHCRSGMVFAINAGDQLTQFQQAATGGSTGSSTGSAGSAGSTASAGSTSSSQAPTDPYSSPNAGRTTVGDVSVLAIGLTAVLFGGLFAL